MAWYIGQSLVMLGASFLLGLLVGWAVWRLPWRRRHFGESDVISALNRQHTLELAERDERIARLQDQRRLDQLPGRVATGGSRDIPQDDPHRLAAQAPDGATAASADSAADFPDAWMATGDHLIPELEPLGDEAQHDKLAPRPPAHFPVSTHADPTGPASPEVDLTRIVGISSDIACTLRAAGLRTYQDLASARPHDVDSALAAGDADRPDTRGTWPRQAQLLADGDKAGFDRLARQLTADREITRGQ